MTESRTPLPEHVTGRELGALLGITPDRVRQLRRAGLIPSAGKDKHPLIESVQRYVAFLRRAGGEPGDLDPRQERALLDRVKREIAELERDQRKGKLLDAGEVVLGWQRVVGISRARLLSLPSVCAPRCVGLETKEIAEVLRRHVYEALDELAHADPGEL